MAALTEREAHDAYDALRGILREQEIDWVVEQVEATISLGKPERRRLTKDDLSERAWRWVTPEVSRRKGPAPVFVVADEYTTYERLVLLVEAVRAAIVQPIAFADAVIEMLPPDASQSSLSFRPELESGRGFDVGRDLLRYHRDEVATLNRLLDELLPNSPDATPTRITF